MHIKKFLEWIGLKEKLHSIAHAAPHVSEGEIWWASIGENIGTEINGKSLLFSRPVIIFRKLTHGFYFVIPVTTQIRRGTWYVEFNQRDKEMTACLHHARSIDYRRLSTRLGELDENDCSKIKDAFRKLYL
jgi:mRNA interferase MazF